MAKGTTVVDDMAGSKPDLEEGRSDAMSAGAGTKTTTRSESAERPMSFQEAFDLAKEKHSAPAGKEQANGDEASTETETATETDTTAAATTARGKTGEAAIETGLITDAEYDALEKKHAGDPKALRRDLEKVFTQKTQKLAEQRTSLARLAPYTDLVDRLESDDEAVQQRAVRDLAEQFGVALTTGGTESREAAKGPTSEETAAKLLDVLKEKLGPELEYLAEGLLPAMQETVKGLLATELAPLRELQRDVQNDKAAARTDTVLKSFAEKHADWSEHEEAIVGLMDKMQPTKGMSELEYLDALYTIVTAPKTAADIDKRVEERSAKNTKAAIDKITKGAADADTRVEGSPDSQVTQRRPEGATIRDSYEAAKNGIRWD